MPIPPHGGSLVDRRVAPAQLPHALERAASLPALTISPWAASDLELLGIGGFSPLKGYLGPADYRSVVEDARLTSGLVWPIPITLPVSRAAAARLRVGQEVALKDDAGATLGILALAEKFTYDKEAEARAVYRTTDTAHPGVRKLAEQGEVLLGGEITLLQRRPRAFADLPDEPDQVRAVFAQRGWRQVAAFQTRNPVHRAHEYMQKAALEIVDGLFLQPLVGQTKADDLPAAVRVQSYRALLERYFPAERVLLGAYPAAMRYAGPREAVLHALVRKNYGCTHFIVGRDHAGVGAYYGTYDAQRIFARFDPAEIGVVPLCFEHTFYCRVCGGMASAKTCPHDPAEQVVLSGTRVRELLQRGELPPPEITRPEVARVLAAGLQVKA